MGRGQRITAHNDTVAAYSHNAASMAVADTLHTVKPDTSDEYDPAVVQWNRTVKALAVRLHRNNPARQSRFIRRAYYGRK